MVSLVYEHLRYKFGANENQGKWVWSEQTLQSEHRMELQFRDQINMLHNAAESTELSERNALMDAARTALQEQKFEIETAAEAKLQSKQVLQDNQATHARR